MVGLGMSELLIILCILVMLLVPLGAGVVVVIVLVTRQRNRQQGRPDAPPGGPQPSDGSSAPGEHGP